MEYLKRALAELFPEKDDYDMILSYSGKFRGYNANAKLRGKSLVFNLSRNWVAVDEEIKMGLVQHLLARLFKSRKKTINMDLYDNFLRSVHMAIPVSHIEPELKESWDRVNDRHFDGLIEPSNLVWGNASLRLFGTYEYGTDTIKINPLLGGKPELIDYVMFHEMLHKKLKFRQSGQKCLHHSTEFRRQENVYPDKERLELMLKSITRSNRNSSMFFNWF